MHAGLDPHGLAYSGLQYGLQNGGGGLNPLGGSHGLGPNPLLTIEQAAAAAAGQLPLSAGLPAGLGGQPNGTAGLPQGGLPLGGDAAAAAAASASAASAEENAANLLSSLSNLSLTDQANLASAAGAAGALQAANALQQAANASANGGDGSGGSGGAISEAQAQAQLAAINAGAASALEAALAGRPPPLGGDGAAGLLAAQQVPGDSSMRMWSVEC